MAAFLFRFFVAGSIFHVGSVFATKVDIADQCDGNCSFRDRALRYESIVHGLSPRFNFSMDAAATESLNTTWHYSIEVTVGGILKVWQSSGVACGKVVFGDVMMIIVSIDFPSCDSEAGRVKMAADFFFRPPIEITPIRARAKLQIVDASGNPAAKYLITIGKGGQEIALTKKSHDDVSQKPQPLFWPGTRMTMQALYQNTSLVQDLALNFSSHFVGPHWTFDVHAKLLERLRIPRYGWKVYKYMFEKTPLPMLVGNGTACARTTEGDDFFFGLEVDFPSCPMEGDLHLHGRTFFLVPFDAGGRLSMTIDLSDGDSGVLAATLLVEVHFLSTGGVEASEHRGNKSYEVLV